MSKKKPDHKKNKTHYTFKPMSAERLKKQKESKQKKADVGYPKHRNKKEDK